MGRVAKILRSAAGAFRTRWGAAPRNRLVYAIRPGQPHPNELERALLGALAAEYPDAGISVPDLQVVSREFTGVGSFTNFLVKGQPPVPRRVLDSSTVVTIRGLKYGLGVVAFREDEGLTLETYANGDELWDGVFDGFTVLTGRRS